MRLSGKLGLTAAIVDVLILTAFGVSLFLQNETSRTLGTVILLFILLLFPSLVILFGVYLFSAYKMDVGIFIVIVMAFLRAAVYAYGLLFSASLQAFLFWILLIMLPLTALILGAHDNSLEAAQEAGKATPRKDEVD